MSPHRTGLVALALCAMLAACHKKPRPSVDAALRGPRAKLEIDLLDDEVDPLAGAADLPAGASLKEENVPLGPGVSGRVHYARIVPQSGETLEQAGKRLAASLASRPLPPGHRFVLRTMSEDEAWGHGNPVAMRSYLVAGDAIVRETDVEDVAASEGPDPVVLVTLTPAAAGRFGVATTKNLRRRLAIVVDDRVLSAPVIQAPIRGGNLSITLGQFASLAAKQAEAQRLAHALGGR
jgi:preprotein translocase subunit SecD